MRLMAKYNMNRNISLRDYYRIFLTIAIGFIITMSTITISFSTVSAFHQAKEYEFVKKWGSRGTGDGQFKRPHDLDFDPAEKYLYVIDRDGDRIEVFDKNGTFINKWGSQGNGTGQFQLPYGLDVDSQGNVWVAERAGARIQKFDINGNFIKSWGSKGTGDGQFNVPVSVVIDSKGNIVVNERGGNSRVQKFDSDGNFLLKFGSLGSGDGQFSHVEHIATDKYDNIYVNDPQGDATGSGQPRVQKFDTNGNFITKWGSNGTENGQFIDPEHLAIDSDGYVYVSDRATNNIKVFRPIDTVPHQ